MPHLIAGIGIWREGVVVAKGKRHRFALVVIADGRTVRVVEVVIELQIFLIARLKSDHAGHQVVSIREGRVGIRQRECVNQYFSIRVEGGDRTWRRTQACVFVT